MYQYIADIFAVNYQSFICKTSKKLCLSHAANVCSKTCVKTMNPQILTINKNQCVLLFLRCTGNTTLAPEIGTENQ